MTDGRPIELEAPIARWTKPLRIFAQHQLAGSVLLLTAAAVALVWANSPWAHSYHEVLHLPIRLEIGHFVLEKPVHIWINDGLMGFFFFVVGLEIKREFLAGSLASPRKAALPIVAAIGGMVVPALVYWAFNAGGTGARGWGIPMATDIAFALGVLALLGSRVPVALKVFLTALAIVDDLGAILVIAIFYTDAVLLQSLALGAVILLSALAANRMGVGDPIPYFILGTLAWLAFLQSGVHATLAAVLMAWTIPARTRLRGDLFLEAIDRFVRMLRHLKLPNDRRLLTSGQHHVLEGMADALEEATAPLQRLEHALVPIVTFLVVPLFALANAGVTLTGDLFELLAHPVALGIIAGLFLGKQLGIFFFAWLAVRVGLADLPDKVEWRQLYGVAVLGGIGFTMSLFIESLAFRDPALEETAKLAILLGSLLSAVVGTVILRSRPADPGAAGAPQTHA